jgi:site-specific recombinase XerD
VSIIALFMFTDIVKPGVGIWGTHEVTGLIDPTLKKLAADLPTTLLASWSNNTNKAYNSAFKKWATWADGFTEVSALPATALHVSLYLVALSQQKASVSTINVALAAIAWSHRLAGYASPTEHKTVKITAEGVKRQASKPRKVASPISPENIFSMVSTTKLDCIQDMRIMSLILLAFAGFLRFSEVSSIRTEHVCFKGTHIELFLPSAKNDQFRQGQTVYIACTGKSTCPVSMLQKYLALASIDLQIEQYIFRNVQHKRGKISLACADRCMTYSRVNELVKEKFKAIGLDCSLYKLHSLRAGGSSAAANHHVPERAFQRHGRWRTTAVKDRYITDSLQDLLAVSQNLGI